MRPPAHPSRLAQRCKWTARLAPQDDVRLIPAQPAALDGLADILVEIDDATGDLVEPGKTRLLVGDLGGRRLGDHLVARLQGGGRRWRALGLALSRRQSRQRIGSGRRVGDAWT